MDAISFALYTACLQPTATIGNCLKVVRPNLGSLTDMAVLGITRQPEKG